METIGVEAVVEGLGSFLGDIGKVNGALDSLRPQATWLENAFGTVTDAIAGFGREILNIAEVTIGVMLRDAFNWILRTLGEIASEAFRAGSEFQLMNVRLQGFNLKTAIDSGLEYNDAIKEATRLTEEQINWLMKLAVTTAFSPEEIINSYTLLRSYRFTSDEAQELTKNIMDFTSAMGLSGVEAERIIVNFGQMAMAGKITSREMNDLARGAFVPVRDILGRVGEKLGKTTEEMVKMVQTPGMGVDYKLFVEAFNEMITSEDQYIGASERMVHTFKGATDNMKESLISLVGDFLIFPGILDPIGQKLGDIMDEVGNRWFELQDAFTEVGTALGDVFTEILNVFMPSATGVVDGIIIGMQGLAEWITTNKQPIIDFFLGIADTIKNDIVPWIRDELIPFFGRIKDWVVENGPLIKEFFSTLGEILLDVVDNLFGGWKKKEGEGGGGFLETVKEVMQWIIDNKEMIANIITAFVIWEINMALMNVVIGATQDLLSKLINPIGLLTTLISGIAAEIWLFVQLCKDKIEETKQYLVDLLIDILKMDWFGAGHSVIWGIINGISGGRLALIDTLMNIVIQAYNRVKSFLGIHSPSTLYMELGQRSVQGMIEGVTNYGTELTKSWQGVVASAYQATANSVASSGSVSSSYQTNNNNYFNQTINTRANSEPIIQDFRAMKSMVV